MGRQKSDERGFYQSDLQWLRNITGSSNNIVFELPGVTYFESQILEKLSSEGKQVNITNGLTNAARNEP